MSLHWTKGMSFPLTPAFLMLSLAFVGPAHADATVPQRAELPIKIVTLPDGAQRYSVPVTIGDTTVEAGLDTGSTGLRVLPGTLKPSDAKSTGTPDRMQYGSGATLKGTVATGTVSVAGIKGDMSFEQIEEIGCSERRPNCPASKVSMADYGIMGNGQPGAGFKAIFGIGSKGVNVDSPLKRLGVTRYIVDLPRDKAETGRIVLNPDQKDVEGFVAIPAYKRIPAQTQLPDDAVTGCLVEDAGGKKICGAVTFDTGLPRILVVSPDSLGEAWPDGTKASIVLDDGAGHTLMKDDMAIGAKDEASKLTFRQMQFLPKTIIRMGVAPYFTYSVLYDLERGGMALKARPKS